MAVHVIPNPARVSWALFRPVNSIPGTGEEAQINPEMSGLEKFSPVRTQAGRFQVPSLTIRVGVNRHNTMILKKANKTNELLSHEQGHFDLLVLVARALARDLEVLEAGSVEELGTLLQEAREQHDARAQAIDEAYDDQTRHSLDRAAQQRWDTAIKAALGNPNATEVAGMRL